MTLGKKERLFKVKRFTNKIISALALVSISTAAVAATKGLDGYEFYKGEFHKTQIDLTVVEVKDSTELRTMARKMGANLPPDTGAFSAWSPDNNKCVIYIITPTRKYMPEQMGHELMHCMYGRWHDYGE